MLEPGKLSAPLLSELVHKDQVFLGRPDLFAFDHQQAGVAMLDPDANMPRINQGMVYLGASHSGDLTGTRAAGERAGIAHLRAYFDKDVLPKDWPSVLLDPRKHWPTHKPILTSI